MKSKQTLFSKNIWVIILLSVFCAWGNENGSNSAIPDTNSASILFAEYEQEYSKIHIEPARLNSQFGFVAIFEGTSDLHYYANPETAPVPEYILTIKAESDDFTFDEPNLPQSKIFNDPLGNQADVYAGNFTVFIPIQNYESPETSTSTINITISGQVCTSATCLLPITKSIQIEANWNNRETWTQVNIENPSVSEEPVETSSSRSIWLALGMAFLAGLTLNIMPCVWPVLPLIVMRIVNQAKMNRSVSVALGLSFCIGVLLFFVILAGANIALQLISGTVLQWGDQFRNPVFVSVMALLLVLLSLFMFGVFTFTVPSVISSKQSSGKGYLSAVGMGLLAAVLSTPCSFGILAAAFAWAQSQPLVKSTFGIMFIGLGMALPYFVLTSVPGLLNRLPKPGRWMEIFKQGVGFILLIIAVKLIIALPEARAHGVLYFSVVLAFCTWMWGTWIDFNTKPAKKWLVRIFAITLASIAGWTFLSTETTKLIDWQSYDDKAIKNAIDSNQPVLIKFTADWCFSCQVVEKSVYSRKDIANLIKSKNILPIKADTTEQDFPATIALKKVYNEPGVPVSILLLPGPNPPFTWRGILFATDLKKQLEQLPDIKRE
ncbi:MAG: thioredoxin family protein [Sedimentisphaerales bacterium]|nr:thioredoxin family protein [Sedimentisphaerales bacterium]